MKLTYRLLCNLAGWGTAVASVLGWTFFIVTMIWGLHINLLGFNSLNPNAWIRLIDTYHRGQPVNFVLVVITVIGLLFWVLFIPRIFKGARQAGAQAMRDKLNYTPPKKMGQRFPPRKQPKPQKSIPSWWPFRRQAKASNTDSAEETIEQTLANRQEPNLTTLAPAGGTLSASANTTDMPTLAGLSRFAPSTPPAGNAAAVAASSKVNTSSFTPPNFAPTNASETKAPAWPAEPQWNVTPDSTINDQADLENRIAEAERTLTIHRMVEFAAMIDADVAGPFIREEFSNLVRNMTPDLADELRNRGEEGLKALALAEQFKAQLGDNADTLLPTPQPHEHQLLESVDDMFQQLSNQFQAYGFEINENVPDQENAAYMAWRQKRVVVARDNRVWLVNLVYLDDSNWTIRPDEHGQQWWHRENQNDEMWLCPAQAMLEWRRSAANDPNMPGGIDLRGLVILSNGQISNFSDVEDNWIEMAQKDGIFALGLGSTAPYNIPPLEAALGVWLEEYAFPNEDDDDGDTTPSPLSDTTDPSDLSPLEDSDFHPWGDSNNTAASATSLPMEASNHTADDTVQQLTQQLTAKGFQVETVANSGADAALQPWLRTLVAQTDNRLWLLSIIHLQGHDWKLADDPQQNRWWTRDDASTGWPCPVNGMMEWCQQVQQDPTLPTNMELRGLVVLTSGHINNFEDIEDDWIDLAQEHNIFVLGADETAPVSIPPFEAALSVWLTADPIPRK